MRVIAERMSLQQRQNNRKNVHTIGHNDQTQRMPKRQSKPSLHMSALLLLAARSRNLIVQQHAAVRASKVALMQNLAKSNKA
jgi:hypothetical protein